MYYIICETMKVFTLNLNGDVNSFGKKKNIFFIIIGG